MSETSETGGTESRSRTGSTSTATQHAYPTIAQLESMDTDTLSKTLQWLTKANLICELREAISQLVAAKSQLQLLPDINTKLDSLIPAIKSSLSLPEIKQTVDRIEAKSYAAVTETISSEIVKVPTHDNPKQHETNSEHQLRFIGIPESIKTTRLERQLHDKSEIEKVISSLDVTGKVVDCHRLGTYNSSKTRTILVSFDSPWDARKCLSQAIQSKLYQSNGILVLRGLSASELQTERALLKKRYELIESGVARSELKIRNNKLFRGNLEITLN